MVEVCHSLGLEPYFTLQYTSGISVLNLFLMSSNPFPLTIVTSTWWCWLVFSLLVTLSVKPCVVSLNISGVSAIISSTTFASFGGSTFDFWELCSHWILINLPTNFSSIVNSISFTPPSKSTCPTVTRKFPSNSSLLLLLASYTSTFKTWLWWNSSYSLNSFQTGVKEFRMVEVCHSLGLEPYFTLQYTSGISVLNVFWMGSNPFPLRTVTRTCCCWLFSLIFRLTYVECCEVSWFISGVPVFLECTKLAFSWSVPLSKPVIATQNWSEAPPPMTRVSEIVVFEEEIKSARDTFNSPITSFLLTNSNVRGDSILNSMWSRLSGIWSAWL